LSVNFLLPVLIHLLFFGLLVCLLAFLGFGLRGSLTLGRCCTLAGLRHGRFTRRCGLAVRCGSGFFWRRMTYDGKFCVLGQVVVVKLLASGSGLSLLLAYLASIIAEVSALLCAAHRNTAGRKDQSTQPKEHNALHVHRPMPGIPEANLA